MAIDTRTAGQNRRGLRGSPIKGAVVWIRQYPGSQTSTSQKAIDAISNTNHFPLY